MAISLNDNIEIVAPKPTDSRYFASANIPWGSIATVNSGINVSKRFIGLTVNINNVEYWYKDGVADNQLILKSPDLSNKADLVDGKVPASQLPSYVDDVIEVANLASLPTTGETGKIYITIDTNKTYRWSGTVYIEISAGVSDHTLLLNIGTNTHAQIDTHIASTNNPHQVTKEQIGLPNVDNTSDANKPISIATQTALNAKETTITAGSTSQYFRGDKSFQNLDKNAVGLNNVDNTSDVNKPISIATQDALDAKADILLIEDEFYYDSNGIFRPNISTYRQVEIATLINQTFTLDFEPTFIISVIKDGINLLQSQYIYTAPYQLQILTNSVGQTIEVVYDKFIILP